MDKNDAVISTVTTLHQSTIEETTESKTSSAVSVKGCRWFFHRAKDDLPWVILVRCSF